MHDCTASAVSSAMRKNMVYLYPNSTKNRLRHRRAETVGFLGLPTEKNISKKLDETRKTLMIPAILISIAAGIFIIRQLSR